MKQKLNELKEETEDSVLIVVYFNTPDTLMHRTIKQKIKREIEDLKNTLKHLDLTDVRGKLQQTAQEYIILKFTESIFQDRTDVRSQNKS